jgi:thiol:disulfide interchange protein DsbD
MYQRHFPRLCLLLILALCATATPRAEEEFLLPEEAFPVVAVAEGPNTLVLNWSVAEGYYLYRNKFKFRSLTEGIRTGEPRLPAGEKRQDEFFGEVEILRGAVVVGLPIERKTGGGTRLSLEVSSQGCADAGLCYPPHRQTLALELPPLASDGGAVDKAKPLAPSNKSALTQSLGLTAPTEDQALLPAEEAFRLAAEVIGPDRLRLTWTIAEGTYLYRDKLALGLEGSAGISIGHFELPPAELVKNAVRPDGSLGDVALYRERIDLDLPIHRGDTAATTITLVAKFQGCADIGVCYPPRKERIELALPAAAGAALAAVAPGGEPQTAPAARLAKADLTASPISTAPATPPRTATGPSPQPSAPISEQDRIAATLASGNVWAALALFFGFGLLLALTPCVFPMIPILSGIIAGHGPGLSTRKAFWMSLTYVLAMSLTYAIAGLLAGLGGANLQAAFQDPWILSLFALVFVALALSMFGFL